MLAFLAFLFPSARAVAIAVAVVAALAILGGVYVHIYDQGKDAEITKIQNQEKKNDKTARDIETHDDSLSTDDINKRLQRDCRDCN